MKDFEYFEPESIGEAVDLLSRYGAEARLLAGGTDLLVELNARHAKPKCVISLGRLKELDFVAEDDGDLRIGARCTHANLAHSPLVRQKAIALAEAAGQIGAPQTRNLGTIAGNIVWASPAADTAPPLLALGAAVKTVGPEGPRSIPIEQFFVGVNKTALRANELITEIVIPPDAGAGSCFLKFGKRKSMATSVVSAAAAVSLNGGSTIKAARVSLGAVAPTPVRARGVESLLVGKRGDPASIAEAAEAVVSDISPITDGRAPAWYRQDISKVLVKRALAEAVERAKSS